MNWSLPLEKYHPKLNKRFSNGSKALFVGRLIVAALLIILLDSLGRNIIQADNETVIFEDVSSSAGFQTVGSNSGAVWVDYDNDGLEDLYVGHHAAIPTTHRNLDGAVFSEVSVGLDRYLDSHGFSWGDYDNDGDLDFYVARGGDGYADRIQLVKSNKRIKFITNNDGHDTFSFIHSGDQITLSVWFAGYAAQTRWIFIGLSGYHPPDTTSFVLNDNDPQNWGKPSYTPGEDRGLFIWKTENEWHVVSNNDRFIGIVTSNGSISQMTPIDVEPYVSDSPKENFLYRNNGDGTFTNVINESGIGDYPDMTTNSAAWVDFDNDGDLDLYEVNQGDIDIQHF